MKKVIKKLSINKETVRRLTDAELSSLQGGRAPDTASCFIQCETYKHCTGVGDIR